MAPPGLVLFVVVLVGMSCSSSAYGSDDLFERYSKIKLLTSCLGQETMARWRQQMVAASKTCEDQQPFIPALLHQMPTFQSQPTSGTIFLHNKPFSKFYQPHHNHHHQQPPPPKPKPQQSASSRPQFAESQILQKFVHNPQSYYVTAPFTHQKYYVITQPQQFRPSQQIQTFSGAVNPQTASHSSNKPAVAAYFKYQATPQGYQPQQATSLSSQQQTTEIFTFNPKLVPGGFVAPNIQYLTIQQQLQQQQKEYEQQQKLWSQKADSGSTDSALPLQSVRQEHTYTNPALKYEDTEQYQDQQKLLAALQEQNQAGKSPMMSSFHQNEPFTQDEEQVEVAGSERDRRSPNQDGHHDSRPNPFHQHQQQPPSPVSTRELQLRAMRTRVDDKISNMTCVMRAMKLLTAELEPNFPFLENSLLELPISNELYEELKQSQEYCKLSAKCQPRRSHLHDLPISPEFSSSLEFFRCFGKEKLRACLKADVVALAQLLGTERGPLTGPNVGSNAFHGSMFQPALEDLENLLNGSNGQFVDLVLL